MPHPFAGKLATWPTNRVVETLGEHIDTLIAGSRTYADAFLQVGSLTWDSPYRPDQLADLPVGQVASQIGEDLTHAVAATITAIARNHHEHIDKIETAWNTWRSGGAWELRPLPAPTPWPPFDPAQAPPPTLVLTPRRPEHTITHQSNRVLGDGVESLIDGLRANANTANKPNPGYETATHPGHLFNALDRANARHAKAAAFVHTHAADWLEWAWQQLEHAARLSLEDQNHWHRPILRYPGPTGKYW
ncbi:hypothetical protein [Segniliparus rugosus]|uniref:Uncharacterized protein n=1 Tax=Segniliparus rugosus (strain ATCC BAA-974 / DSM 45345 / CCUG 50838 / CIP 108380 / JCM 13579 / CDC 945) TaxID=679197 RepID=E5XQI3_SEGRC|nr:hypothetical protein [Segniliparus rugosus]EFV13401.2 hypothetical protein HMPREF9336_01755 [Segniliparus rugosus ATCC BAA-974]